MIGLSVRFACEWVLKDPNELVLPIFRVNVKGMTGLLMLMFWTFRIKAFILPIHRYLAKGELK